MSRKHLAVLTALATMVALACVASFANAAGTAQAQTRPTASALAGTTTQVGAVTVRLTVKRFIKRGKNLYAVGTAISRFKPSADQAGTMPSKTVKKAFTARVVKVKRFSSAKRICPVLELTLAPLDLNLLGPDRAPRQGPPGDHRELAGGGLLGSLLCGLSRANGSAARNRRLKRLTKAARTSGLATKGVHMGRAALPDDVDLRWESSLSVAHGLAARRSAPFSTSRSDRST